MANQIQPIFILPEGSQRTTGKNAQKSNIEAAKAVAETVRTTLGPKGMDKMIVDSLGDVTITNDGVTILEEIGIEHPAAKMIVEVAKTQEAEVGDGTTSAVVIAGELLKQAEALLDQSIHPTVLARGYRLATEKSLEILEKMAEDITISDKGILKKIAMTAMTGKGAESAKENLAELAVAAVLAVADDGMRIDQDNIKIEKKVGAGQNDSELIRGIVLDKEVVHVGMPHTLNNARIALVDSSLEIKSTEIDAKINITDPEQMQAFIDQEERMLRRMVEKITASGANVLFCQKGIDDIAQHFLAKNKIMAARRVKKSDMEKLARATGATVVSNLDDLGAAELGKAGLVEERKVGDENMIFVRECPKAKAVTLLIRGGTEHVVDEVRRAVTDAIGDLIAALTVGKVVAGAGSVEIELARQLKSYAETLSGREQLAVNAFATSLEVIPKTLAENAGLDPIDIMTNLKSAHETKKWAGINVFSGKIIDAWKEGVIEPLKIKTQAIKSASEVAIMILRIDDVISGSSNQNPQGHDMPPMM